MFRAWVFVLTLLFSFQLQARTVAVRGNVLHFKGDPFVSLKGSYEYIPGGVLYVKNGKVEWVGEASEAREHVPRDLEIKQYPHHLILPGMIDTHIHYPQTEMIAAFGEQLLDWLKTYTFPNERKFKEKKHAESVSQFFLNELIKNGTTTALVFGTVHPQSVDAFFEKAEALKMRMVAGKVMMDRNAPDFLTDTAESSYVESKALIEKWHNKEGTRLQYAITPRFAPTSTPEQLTKAGELWREFPTVLVHTHLSENLDEIAWVKELFPARKGYLDVYDHYGLVGRQAVFAHGVHLTDKELQTMGEKEASIAFCPTSNLFLGSGLIDLEKTKKHGVHVGLGTDVGAGTSFSQLETLNEAYKVAQLQKQKLSALRGFYLATLAGAESLGLESFIGNFEKGKEGDFVILDYQATPLMKRRYKNSTGFEDALFSLMMLGDDRAVRATYVDGTEVYARP